MEFAIRLESSGPVFVGNYDSSGPIAIEPIVGNSVILKSEEISILVRIVTAIAREYSGEIVGYENYDGYEYEGSKPGDIIVFQYGNIFSISS